MKLGIVGHGFVGTAVDHGFTKDVQKFIVDPKHNSTNTIEDLIAFKPDATFVAVPTPQLESGECNTAIREDVMQQLNQCKGLLVIVKSTVPAYKLEQLKEQCVDLRIVYNPEFLTEANAHYDFLNPNMQVLGGKWRDCDKVEKAYSRHSNVKVVPTYKVDLITASLIKYTINSWLATKVVFFNELYELHKASKTKIPWENFVDMLSREDRVGSTHMRVPGPDGDYGFGGHCFPKDTAAFLHYANQMGVDLSVLAQAVDKNKKLR